MLAMPVDIAMKGEEVTRAGDGQPKPSPLMGEGGVYDNHANHFIKCP